jgi:hypothetical protein
MLDMKEKMVQCRNVFKALNWYKILPPSPVYQKFLTFVFTIQVTCKETDNEELKTKLHYMQTLRVKFLDSVLLPAVAARCQRHHYHRLQGLDGCVSHLVQ